MGEPHSVTTWLIVEVESLHNVSVVSVSMGLPLSETTQLGKVGESERFPAAAV